MADLRDELDDNLVELLHELEVCAADDSATRKELVDDIVKLYKIRLEEKKMDNDFECEYLDSLNKLKDDGDDRRDKIIDHCVNVGIAALKVGATLIGYCLVAKMHANSIVADSYGTLQRSASFRIIPSMNPAKDL